MPFIGNLGMDSAYTSRKIVFNLNALVFSSVVIRTLMHLHLVNELERCGPIESADGNAILINPIHVVISLSPLASEAQ